MGTKWFTFYTKVRPILSGLFLLAVLESFRLNLAIYTKIWWLTLSFAGAVAQFVLCILIAVKSGGDYPHFVRFTRKVLLFETIYTAYQQGVETYVRNFDMISALIVFFVISIVLYFIWYRLNVSGTRLPPLWAMPLRPAFMKERLGLLAKVDKFYFAENAAQNS